MRTFFSIISALLLIIIICGCHGGEDLGLKDSEPSGDYGHISGLVYTVLPAKAKPEKNQLYYYRDINVTATSTEGKGTYQTTTKHDGVYSFLDIPNGNYNITASLTIDGVTYTGEIKNIVVRGSLTTAMSNILLFNQNSGNAITFRGKVTDNVNGNAVVGATVNMEVGMPKYGGNDPDSDDHYLKNHGTNCDCFEAMIFTTTTDSNGDYSFKAPKNDGSTTYFLSARYKNSVVSELQIASPSDDNVKNISLAVYEELEMPTQEIAYICAYTLKTEENLSKSSSSSTVKSADILAAYAKANKIKGKNLETINKAVAKRNSADVTMPTVASSKIGDGYFVEMDLMWQWAVDNGSLGNVYGYNIYRGSSANGNFYKIMQIADPYLLAFYDLDPTLEINVPVYYTITSYGAFNKESLSSVSVSAQAMGTVNITSPDVVNESNRTLSWNTLSEANSYTVFIYKSNTMPSLNIDYVRSEILTSYQSPQLDLLKDSWAVGGGKLTAGTYWVAVVASDAVYGSGLLPFKLSYSGFKKFIIP